MDIVGAIGREPVIDLGIFLGLFGFMILGVMQGSIRRVLGIISVVFSFLVAANLRDPVGDFLAGNWTQFSRDYNRLLAFLIFFAAGVVISAIVIQIFYRRIDIHAERPIVDDVLGGFLGLLEGFLLLTMAVVIFNSHLLPDARPGDLTQLRQLQDSVVNQSVACGWLRDVIVPPFVHVLGVFLPSDLVSHFS
jgi:uncharacterized membrane protein required for colicin V production